MRIRKYRTLQYLPQTRGSHHTSDAVCRKQGNQGKPGNQETGEKPGTVTGNQGEETRRETRKPSETRKPGETRNQGQSPITGLRNGAILETLETGNRKPGKPGETRETKGNQRNEGQRGTTRDGQRGTDNEGRTTRDSHQLPVCATALS